MYTNTTNVPRPGNGPINSPPQFNSTTRLRWLNRWRGGACIRTSRSIGYKVQLILISLWQSIYTYRYVLCIMFIYLLYSRWAAKQVRRRITLFQMMEGV